MRSTKMAFKSALALLTIAALALPGCAGRPDPIIETRIVEVPVPVATGCISDAGRPEAVKPLRDTITPEEWQARAPGAKAETIRAQAGTRMNRTDKLEAATSECK